MNSIYQLVESMAAGYLILRSLMELVPSEEYKKYVKLFGSFLIIILVVEQIPFGLHNINEKRLENVLKIESQKLNEGVSKMQKYDKTAESKLLSTYEEEIKTRINNLIKEDKYAVKSLKISICEDVDSVDYGKISDVNVIVSKDVDKTANISVNKIIVRQKTNTPIKSGIENKISESLALPEEAITVTYEE